MQKSKPIQWIGSVILILSCFLLIRCDSGPTNIAESNDTGNITQQTAANFENEAELETYLKDQFAKSIQPQSLNAIDDTVDYDEATPSAGDAETLAGDQDNAKSDTDTRYSETNNQESGVDESDKTKTDGTHIYIAGTNDLSIIDVSDPDNMKEVYHTDIKGNIQALHLYQNILAVLYTPEIVYAYPTEKADIASEALFCPYWIPVKVQTSIRLYDITAPAAPEMINETTIDGNLISTRVIDGKLHVVQRFLPDLLQPDQPRLEYYYDGTEAGLENTVSNNANALADLSLDELLPHYEVVDKEDRPQAQGRLVEPQNFYRPATAAGGSMVTVSTLDLADPTQAMQSVGIVANADIVYASQQALYVVASKWAYYINIRADDSNDTDQVTTEIQKFDLTGDQVVSAGSGTVNGEIINQFALGEYDGVLRVATKTNTFWGEKAARYSSVYCLQPDPDTTSLKVIGKIENIAPEETLYAARFIGPRGYLVTFEQIDPLFTLDLSDPTNPKVAGELKIPGYSSYIHPISDTLLLTIGKDTESIDGRVLEKGIQLSLFDISDFANPQLLYKENIGDRGTYSEALYDHKAFTYWSEEHLLAVPIDLYSIVSPSGSSFDYGTYDSTGLYVYRVDSDNGFDFLGRITTAEASDNYFYSYYDGYWTRAIFIDDHVFTVKESVIYSAQTDDIDHTIQKLVIKEPQKTENYGYPEGATDAEEGGIIAPAESAGTIAN